ncbi:ADL092Wp [Eremothecium gossypii ATCC 10895]|uniref:ADL092Wp n=1 Tax=Eremothecium gossypii (strain ATCC 10895 / CBS 109.51 / FGSC 9923 / NRRL Y-1056) TaxID=284811 RepID=Q75B02_EREGS|nr:ADL092Wp [Eremothecium gossypii ATCC 10895]AAS51828.1 ADL092Wp [Eremothecium gossypii ATCC 10895]AEY96125.1 FADL092Wp [Eremothecium gossypii FDAG1]
MSYISKILLAISVLQLVHSGFSSFEFHRLKRHLTLADGIPQGFRLPSDIKAEVVCALVLFTLGIFLSFEKLQHLPLTGSRTPLTQDLYLHEIRMSEATKTDNLIGSETYGDFTFMPSFIDVHARRKEIRTYMQHKNQ